ncbi:MAG: ABC-2 family transporter protein [Candidatus Portnoybacteria bacterium]|nr:ABC-2 family transporter protein [Candidatus Portnoybacteria bacterium]
MINTYWQRSLAYRFTVLAYRVGEVMEVLVLILMWSAIYGEQAVIRGFTLKEMLTYVLIGNLFNVVTRNWLEQIVAEHIKDGKLSMILVQPVSYFQYIIFREIGRISLPTVLSVGSQIVVLLFFLDTLIINTDIWYLLLIVAMLIFAFVIELFISFLIGLIAFWTDEVDGIYATISRLKKFLSGGYFPLNLLPPFFLRTSLLFPFAYSIFVPAQLYLKKISLESGMQGLLIQCVWIFLLYSIIRVVWYFGIRKYEGVGI